jgi:hypothetical protein
LVISMWQMFRFMRRDNDNTITHNCLCVQWHHGRWWWVMSICMHVLTKEYLDGWSWNLLWLFCYALRGYSKIILFNFLQLLIPSWWMHKVIRWDSNDNIIHNHLWCVMKSWPLMYVIASVMGDVHLSHTITGE